MNRIENLLSYGLYRIRERSAKPAAPAGEALAEPAKELLTGWPRNHNYRICNGRLIPCFRLYERHRQVSRHYPPDLASLRDLGCCRGYYVLEAALRPSCHTAVGIDIHPPFITLANLVGRHLNPPGTRLSFHVARLGDIAKDPAGFGGPFQRALLLGKCPLMNLSKR